VLDVVEPTAKWGPASRLQGCTWRYTEAWASSMHRPQLVNPWPANRVPQLSAEYQLLLAQSWLSTQRLVCSLSSSCSKIFFVCITATAWCLFAWSHAYLWRRDVQMPPVTIFASRHWPFPSYHHLSPLYKVFARLLYSEYFIVRSSFGHQTIPSLGCSPENQALHSLNLRWIYRTVERCHQPLILTFRSLHCSLLSS